MEEWRHRVRTLVVRSSQAAWVRNLLRQACRLGTWFVGRRLASIPGVDSVYVRHSHPASLTFAPGQSDLDLTLVLNDEAAQDPALVRACADQISRLNRVFYFVWPPDARFAAWRELTQMEALPGAAEILNTTARWIRIGGQELRRASNLSALATNHIALHPEFNAWWMNVMQTHVLTPQTKFVEANMRLCFRAAMKNQLYLQAARGRVDLASEAYLPDSKAASLFADDVEMASILAQVKSRDFWAQDSHAEKATILQRSIAGAADFYRQLPLPATTSWLAPTGESAAALMEAHRSELRNRFEQAASLRSIVESVIIYRTPHWSPCEYQIDLILNNEVSPAAFREAVQVIKTSFGGRTFGIGGTHAQLTLIPRSAYEHPSFFLGTPFPFLHEHVATFAKTLTGAPPRIPAPPSRSERLQWCARYYLFHRFTLLRRPAYVSKDCNFCQLAAVRLFLECGTAWTDAVQVRSEYLARFAKNSEDGETLDALLRGAREIRSQDPHTSFAISLRIQAQEYDAIESLLHRYGALP